MTVLAEAGGRSTYNPDQYPFTSSFLARHPIHVLVQDVQVTISNLYALAERLADALADYENDIVTLRQEDCHTTSTQQMMDDGVQSPVFGTQPTHQQHIPSTPSHSQPSPFLRDGPSTSGEPTPLNSLEFGLWALRLLPRDGKAVLVYVADGISSVLRPISASATVTSVGVGTCNGGDCMFRDICRRLARENIYVTVIQAG